MNGEQRIPGKKEWIIFAVVVLFLITIGIIGCPTYKVYTNKMDGKAQLEHAKYSKEVAVAEARAKKESAALLSEADTIRAHGIARANQIIGQSLKGNESYLYWLWIDNMEKNQNATYYIPTENNLPIFTKGQLTGSK